MGARRREDNDARRLHSGSRASAKWRKLVPTRQTADHGRGEASRSAEAQRNGDIVAGIGGDGAPSGSARR